MLTHSTSRGGLIYICSVVFALAFSLVASQGLMAQVTIQPLWSTPVGHTNSVYTANFNSTGDQVVTSSQDNTAKIWNISTGALIATLKGHSSNVTDANFNSAGDRVVTASNDHTAKIWSASSGALIAQTGGHAGEVNTAKINNRGDRIVTASYDKTAKIWDASSGALIAILSGHNGVVRMANFNGAGDRVVTASDDHTAKIWNASTGALIATLSGHTGAVNTAIFNSTGDRIVTASYDKTAKIWNASTGALIAILSGHASYVNTASFNLSGDRIVTASYDGTAKIWDASTGALIATLSGHTDLVRTANFNGAGDRVVTASYDHTAKIWNASSGTLTATLSGHTDYVVDVKFNNVDDRIVTASYDGTAKIWNAFTGALITTLSGHTSYVSDANFNSTGNRIVTASWDNTAKIWNASTGALISTMSGHSNDVNKAIFNSAGDRIVTASWDSTAKIWNASTGALFATLSGHSGYVWTANFNNTGDRIVTASFDNTARIWNATTGTLIATLSGHKGPVDYANFNGAGDRVVTSSYDHTAKIWNASTGALITTLSGHTDAVNTANFNRTGDRIVTAGEDGTAKVWNAFTGTLITTLSGHTGYVFDAKFNSVGDRVVTVSLDSTAKIWNASTWALIATLRGHASTVFTANFNSTGDRVVTASADNTAKIWNAATGALVATLSGHTGTVWTACFNSAGDRVVTASDDWTAKMWDVSGLQASYPKLSIANLNTSICSGSDTLINVSVSPSTPGLVWQWTLADGSSIPPVSLKSGGTATDSTIRLAPSTTQSYKVSISKSGVPVDSLNFIINVNPQPAPQITGTQSFCSTQNGILYRTARNAGSSYYWSILSGSAVITGLETNDSVRINITAPGIVTLQVRETNASGCSKDTTISISVSDSLKPVISSATGFRLCAGGSVTLDAGSGTSYQWSRDGSTINGATQRTYTANQAGNYSVNVTSGACSGTSDLQAVVAAVSAQPRLMSAGTKDICQGDSVVLSLHPGAYSDYTWSTGQSSSSITVFAAGVYYCSVDSAGCTSRSDSLIVNLNPKPTPTIVSDGSTLSTQSFDSYQWLDSNSVAISGATSQQYKPSSSNKFSVMVTKGPCSGTSAVYGFSGGGGGACLELSSADVGTWYIGFSEGKTCSSTVYNKGTTACVLKSLLSSAKEFVVKKGQLPQTIPPNDSLVIAFRFIPEAAADYSSSINAISDCCSAQGILSGHGSTIAPRDVDYIFVAPSLDTVSPGSSVTINLKIAHTGAQLNGTHKKLCKIHFNSSVLDWGKDEPYFPNHPEKPIPKLATWKSSRDFEADNDSIIMDSRNFVVKLDTEDVSYLNITDFSWDKDDILHSDSVAIRTRDTAVYVRVCTQGGQKRLVTRGPGTKVTMMAPNPGYGSIQISYSVGEDTESELYVVDLQGQRLATLDVGQHCMGSYNSLLNTDGWSNGVYYVILRTAHDFTTQKLIVVE